MKKFKQTIINEINDYKLLLRSVPSLVMVFFCISVVLMNFLANKELLNTTWLALDCGFTLSWISFLCMDMLTKRFGAKAAIKLSLITVFVNLVVSGIFYLISLIPSNWSAYYGYGNPIINISINDTIGGTWYVLLGSTIAFIVSSIVNAIVNSGIGKLQKHNTFKNFAARSYISTALGQFVDNLIFATIVSHVFFGWTWRQVILCSFAGALMELICEIIFSPIGYKVCKKWENQNIGSEYLNHQKNK